MFIATDFNNSPDCQLLYSREQKVRGNILVSRYNDPVNSDFELQIMSKSFIINYLNYYVKMLLFFRSILITRELLGNSLCRKFFLEEFSCIQKSVRLFDITIRLFFVSLLPNHQTTINATSSDASSQKDKTTK